MLSGNVSAKCFLCVWCVCADPIPGGCNLELPLQNDPNLHVTTSASQTHVAFAYGDLNVAGAREPCGSSLQQNIPVYDVYQLYLNEQHLDEETFFATITRMLKADDITATGRWVCGVWVNTPSHHQATKALVMIIVCADVQCCPAWQHDSILSFVVFDCDDSKALTDMTQ